MNNDDTQLTPFSAYAWIDSNRLMATWEEEIEHAKSLGFLLVPPTYIIPHWSEVMGGRFPELFILRPHGMEEFPGSGGMAVGEIGYPVFIQRSEFRAQWQGVGFWYGGEMVEALQRSEVDKLREQLKSARALIQQYADSNKLHSPWLPPGLAMDWLLENEEIT